MIDSLCVASKGIGNGNEQENARALSKAKDDIEKAERITKTLNKSSFMNLGEKVPNLVSEPQIQGSKSGGGQQELFRDRNDEAYLNDETIPADVFSLTQKYRERIVNSKGG